MKTTNWQAKALTLFIAALALWLTAACTENSDAPIYESDVPVYKRIMPLNPCPNDINEYRSLDHQPALPYEERLPHAEKVLEEIVLPTLAREGGLPWHTVDAYLSRRFSTTWLDYEWEGVVIIQVEYFATDVQLSHLPPENRIPHCIEGVPVHFITDKPEVEATIRDYEEPETQN